MTMSPLLGPNGQPIEEYIQRSLSDDQGRARIVGLSPWKTDPLIGVNLDGATKKRESWNEYYQMYRNHSFVRAAIEKIAKVATSGGYEFAPRDPRTRPNESQVTKLKTFFDQQDDFQSQMRRVIKDMLIYGDGYLYVVPNRRREPVKLKRINPRTVHIHVDETGRLINYLQVDPESLPDGSAQVKRVFKPHEFIHFKIDDPNNDVYGLSPLESLKWAVAADLYAQRFNAAFFKNSATSGTIIAIKNSDPSEIERNRKWLQEEYTGPDAAHKPMVVIGDVDVKSNIRSHHDMSFLQLREFTIREILAVIDVPPAKLGMMESANRSNSKEQDKSFRTETIDPLQYIVESAINAQFVRDIMDVHDTIFQFSETDTRDALEAAELHTKYLASGVETINEVRNSMGRPDIDGGDIAYISTPTGAIPVDRMNLFFSLPKLNTDVVPEDPRDPVEGETIQDVPDTTIPGARDGDNVRKSFQAIPHFVAELRINLEQFRQPGSLARAASLCLDLESMMTPDVAARIQSARSLLTRAAQVDDPLVQEGYVNRAWDILQTIAVVDDPDPSYDPFFDDLEVLHD